MAPARQPSEATMREIIARVDGVAKQVEDVGKDAREARDATIALTARLTAENSQHEIAKIWTRIEKGDQEHRQDLINVANRLDGRAKSIEERATALENWRQQIEGANRLMRWAGRVAPWAVSALAAAYGYFHGGGKLP